MSRSECICWPSPWPTEPDCPVHAAWRIAVAKLDAIDAGEPDAAHGEADRILLDAAPAEIRDAYKRVKERAPWWATA